MYLSSFPFSFIKVFLRELRFLCRQAVLEPAFVSTWRRDQWVQWCFVHVYQEFWGLGTIRLYWSSVRLASSVPHSIQITVATSGSPARCHLIGQKAATTCSWIMFLIPITSTLEVRCCGLCQVQKRKMQCDAMCRISDGLRGNWKNYMHLLNGGFGTWADLNLTPLRVV